MEPRDLVRGQLEALRQELGRAQTAIGSPRLDVRFRSRVAPRFEIALEELQARCTEVANRIGRNEPLAGCWADLRALQNDSASMLEECLAFMQGAWARDHGLDEGICAHTDELLDDLAAAADVAWGRFTLLATQELYRPTAEIIRVRYPEISVWSLPLAAHELGHFVGPAIRRDLHGKRDYPFQERLKVADEDAGNGRHTKEWHHLQECFADVFATYTLGPAYAAAFMLLRMNPTEAYDETLTHPSGAARAHGILATLEAMDKREAGISPPFRDITDWLRTRWHAGLAAAGQPEALRPAAAALATQRQAELFEMLAARTPPALRFAAADWRRAQGVAGDLAVAAPAEELTRRDVLNAAWLARLLLGRHDPYAVNDLARKALELYGRLPGREAAAAVAARG